MKKLNVDAFQFRFIMLIFLIIIIILMNNVMNGQTIERQLISFTGNISESANMKLSATSGEIAVNTVVSARIILTQGFQQANPEDFVGTIEAGNINLEYILYPNPTTSSVILNLQSEKQTELLISVFDLLANRVISDRALSFTGQHDEVIDLRGVPAATYILMLKNKKGKLIKSFEIVKME
jgi:hypothetical protein